MIRPIVSTLLASISLAAAANNELKASAQKLFDSHKDSVVWISVIAKTSMSSDGEAPAQIKAALAGQEKEEKSEVTGTIIDESGLIVTALGNLDKSSIVDGQTVNTPMGAIKLKAKSEIKEVKILMPDGSEIPADLVLKDGDLGLAFIKIRTESEEAKGVKFSAVDLRNSEPGKILDDCIALSRLDESLSREPSMASTEITGVTTKPRVFYRAEVGAIGCPIFLSNGKLLGISVLRKPKNGAGNGQIQLSPVILPAADIAKIAEQAKSAKPAEAPKSE